MCRYPTQEGMYSYEYLEVGTLPYLPPRYLPYLGTLPKVQSESARQPAELYEYDYN